jgi:hypothetical protein
VVSSISRTEAAFAMMSLLIVLLAVQMAAVAAQQV